MAESDKDWLKRKCVNCGCSYGGHHAGHSPWPFGYCPDPEERGDWENGPGTTFKGVSDVPDKDWPLGFKGGKK